MNHTEGKLKADGSFIKNRNGEMVAGTTMIAATEGSQSNHEANTRRLVACWNALEGVPTEWLEKYVDVGLENVVQQNAKLIRKEEELTEKLIAAEYRDKAIAALEFIQDVYKLIGCLEDEMKSPSGEGREKRISESLNALELRTDYFAHFTLGKFFESMAREMEEEK